MNMKGLRIGLIVVLVIIATALVVFFIKCNGGICSDLGVGNQKPDAGQQDVEQQPPLETSMIKVSAPLPGSLISSPLRIEGEARGGWYFEGSFPVRLLDGNGNVLASGPAEAMGEWMTTEFVPFRASLSFDSPQTQTGTLVLEKANPSGLPQNADEVTIPVRFSTASPAERNIILYYYNEDKDTDALGNILCSSKGLVGVVRSIPRTVTPIQDSINLLIRGELSSAERAQGISTEFPLAGLELSGAALSGGILTLEFNDPRNATSGGSCRSSILRAQIEATAKQFENVNSVRYKPEDLFQP